MNGSIDNSFNCHHNGDLVFPTNDPNDFSSNNTLDQKNVQKTSTPNKEQRISYISTSSSGVETNDNVSNLGSEDLSVINGSHTDSLSEPLTYSIPILSYEVMEEHTRFTLFKIRVEHQSTGQTWFVFRRYTDFVRLNKKLKVLFRGLRLILPPKRWFGDNFDPIFLEDRILGLQAYIDSILKHHEINQSKPVRDFFCFDDPPELHDSIEESRALCENLEGNIHKLRCQLRNKNTEIEYLRAEISMLKSQLSSLVQSLKLECALTSYGLTQSCNSHCDSTEHKKQSSQMYHLHNLNIAIAQMIENSLCNISDENSDIEVGLDATVLCAESSPSCSSLLEQQVSEVGCKNERRVGDGCVEMGERPTPLGSTDEPLIDEFSSNKKNHCESISFKMNAECKDCKSISGHDSIAINNNCVEMKEKLSSSVQIQSLYMN